MKTITRVRKIKTRYGISNGPCFVGLHLGLRSWYIGKPLKKRLSSRLKAIKDSKGLEHVTTTTGAL